MSSLKSELWKNIKWREDDPEFLYDYNGDWFGTSIIEQASTIESDIRTKDTTEQWKSDLCNALNTILL